MSDFRTTLMLSCVLSLVCEEFGRAGDSVAIREAIQRDWQGRELDYRIARIEWTETERCAAGAYYFGGPLPTGTPRPVSPQRDRLSRRGELVLDGIFGCYRRQGTCWNSRRGLFQEMTELTTYDGRIRQEMTIAAGDDGLRGSTQSNAIGLFDARTALTADLESLVMSFRPLASEFAPLPLQDYELQGVGDFVNGFRCVCLRRSFNGIPFDFLWLDPERGHLLVRRDHHADGELVRRLDIEYDERRFPRHWTELEFSPSSGQFRRQIEGTIRSVRCNDPVPRLLFEWTFPPGTEVEDRGSKPGRFVVRSDGTLRRVEQGEAEATGLSLQELAETPSRGELVERQQRYREMTLWGAATALLALVGAAWNRFRASFLRSDAPSRDSIGHEPSSGRNA